MPQSALTKAANLQDRPRGINVLDLPLTFRDAISIARKSGVPYVWIDSVCIIQDSKEDWETEAAQMSSVYSEAFLTIAATGSSNRSEGCRTDSNSIPIGPVILECSSMEENDPLSSQTVYIFPSDGYQHNFRSQPLHERGWKVQERELSSRILFYTKETIRWECACLKASLRFPWDDTTSFVTEVFNRGDDRWRNSYLGSALSDQEKIETM